MGAKSVVVPAGSGHQRDTQLVLSQNGYERVLREEKIRFVDLNRDDLVRTPLRASDTGMKHLLAASYCAGLRLPGFHAEDQDPSLVWGHAEHEEYVRCRSGRTIRLAEEYSPLKGHSGKHSRSVRHRSSQLRDCGWNYRNGRQWAAEWRSSALRQNCPGG